MRILMAFCAALLFSVPLFATPADPIADRLVTAFNAGNTAAIQKDCAPSYWNSEDSPEWFIKQGYGGPKRAWLFQKGEILVSKTRAAVTMIVLNAEKKTPVDALYFYAENRGGPWLWYGANEEKAFREAYLDGTIDADFTLEGLPALPDLEDLEPSIVDWFATIGAATEDEDVVEPADGAFSLKLAPGGEYNTHVIYDVTEPALVETHWSARLNHGLVIMGGAPNDEGEFEEGMVLYFSKTKDGWALYNTGYMPDIGTFLGR